MSIISLPIMRVLPFIIVLSVQINVTAQQADVLIGPNILVAGGDGDYLEHQIAADPSNPLNLFVAGSLGQNQNYFNIVGGREYGTRGYYSRDGGYTWSPVIYPDLISGAGDPVAAFGNTGTVYFAAISLVGYRKGGILFYRSENGKKWDLPVELTVADHPQIIVDRTASTFSGNIYISVLYNPFHTSSPPDYHVGIFRSSDDGKTWTGPIEVVNNHGAIDGGMNSRNPAVFSDGVLFIPIVSWMRFKGDDQAVVKQRYIFSTSSDGGMTFSPTRRFISSHGNEIAINGAQADFCVDASVGQYKDRIYIAWTEPESFRPSRPTKSGNARSTLWVSFSSDRGKTWSTPRMISRNGIGDQFMPAIAVNKDGVLALSWYQSYGPSGSETTKADRYFAASVDGGKSFTRPGRLSSVSSFIHAPLWQLVRPFASINVVGLNKGIPARDFGWDYLGMTADANGDFHPTWVDNRLSGSNQIWTTRVQVKISDLSSRKSSTLNFVEADVTDRVEATVDPLLDLASTSTIELPVRIKNKSKESIYLPIRLQVTSVTEGNGEFGVKPVAVPVNKGPLLNAINQKPGIGAIFDYSKTLGDLDALPPGAVSEPIIWRFKKPSDFSEFPQFSFKVTARIERPKEISPVKSVAPKP